MGGGQFFAISPHENKQCTYFVSASGSLLEFNVLSIVVQREDGSHVFTSSKDFASRKNWKNLGMPSDGGLIGVLGVFYSPENRRIIACLNAMGKIVFNDNQRWVELNYKPQHLPSRLKKMDNGNGDAVSERRKRKKSKDRSFKKEGSNRRIHIKKR